MAFHHTPTSRTGSLASSTCSEGRESTPSPATDAADPARRGILHLVSPTVASAAGVTPEGSMPHDAVLAQVRAERDMALEEIAYLSEQVRSMESYHAHVLGELRTRAEAERRTLLAELALLGDELTDRTRARAPDDDDALGASVPPRTDPQPATS